MCRILWKKEQDHPHIDTPEVTREKVERSVKKLQNGRAACDDKIVAELVKSGGKTQCGFRKSLGTVDQIWVTRQVMEKAGEYRLLYTSASLISLRRTTRWTALPWWLF